MDRELVARIAIPIVTALLSAVGVGTVQQVQVADAQQEVGVCVEQKEAYEHSINQLVHSMTKACREWRE